MNCQRTLPFPDSRLQRHFLKRCTTAFLLCCCSALPGKLHAQAKADPPPPGENWRPYDLNHDGRLSEAEFKAFEAANAANNSKNAAGPVFSSDPARNERMLKVLRKFDHDADGKWSAAEYRIFKDYSEANNFEFLYDSDFNGKLDSKERRLKNEEIEACEKLFKPSAL